MASEIEVALYGEDWASRVSSAGEVGEHCVLAFSLAEGWLRMRVAPWDWRFSRWAEATFEKVALQHFGETAGEPDDLKLPWGIVGFHSQKLEAGTWQFTLHCHCSRWIWHADWPTIERGTV